MIRSSEAFKIVTQEINQSKEFEDMFGSGASISFDKHYLSTEDSI
jgi:hypothetical protein